MGHPANRHITDKRTQVLLEGLRHGMTRRAAAGVAGFSKSTLYRMLDEDTDGTLRDLIERAEADAEATYSELVARAAMDPKNWTAAAWWLERRRHEDYSRREKVEMTVDVRGIAEQAAQAAGLDADEIMAEADRILADRK
jgi:cation transport regulator ChaC